MRKLDRLIKSAAVVAKWRGHDLSRFTHDKEKTGFAHSSCRVCGASVSVNCNPLPNQIDVGGEAVALDCRTVYEQNTRRQDA